jgi:DNA-binding transcriptional LysR family regulator
MDWDLCKSFVAVAETGSFAAAARRLRSSHPTVGRKITELEDQLGIPLFARSNDGLSLTSQGRKFREHVEAMAAAALRAEAAVSATGAQARGVVKLSIGSTLASHWLMPRLGPFLRSTNISSWRSSPIRFRPACAGARPMSCCGRSIAARRT